MSADPHNPARTLAAPAQATGVGLFTGKPAGLTLSPAPAGTGIRFRRADLPGRPAFTVDWHCLTSEPVHPAFAHLPPRSTNLRQGDARVNTAEHLLSALNALGITDVLIDADGPEVAIFNGAADPFVAMIREAGITSPARPDGGAAPEKGGQGGEWPPAPLTLREPVTVADESARASITAFPHPPHSEREFVYEMDYGPDSPIRPQSASWDGDPETYARRIAPARTFCLAEEAQAMRALGLFENLSPKDFLVFGDEGPIDNTLRWPDELARHKLLDLIGDLALVGRPVHARIVARRSGHALNHALARALAELAQP